MIVDQSILVIVALFDNLINLCVGQFRVRLLDGSLQLCSFNSSTQICVNGVKLVSQLKELLGVNHLN